MTELLFRPNPSREQEFEYMERKQRMKEYWQKEGKKGVSRGLTEQDYQEYG